MKPIIINTELYCHKIKITVTIYDPDFNYFKGTMVKDCPGPVIDCICKQLAEANKSGVFESVHVWLSEDIDTYYSGNWEIVGDYGLHETIFDMAQYACEITESGVYDSRMIASEVIGWAKEFSEKYRNEDWTDLDYYETIHSFATNKIKEFTDNHI
jgi:hypothetical protein